MGYVTKPGHTPRRVAVDRKKKEYEAQDISGLLQLLGITVDMMEESRAVDEKDPADSVKQVLPLSFFDDDTFEIYSPQEWIVRGQGAASAKTLRDGEWVPCIVSAYDSESK